MLILVQWQEEGFSPFTSSIVSGFLQVLQYPPTDYILISIYFGLNNQLTYLAKLRSLNVLLLSCFLHIISTTLSIGILKLYILDEKHGVTSKWYNLAPTGIMC